MGVRDDLLACEPQFVQHHRDVSRPGSELQNSSVRSGGKECKSDMSGQILPNVAKFQNQRLAHVGNFWRVRSRLYRSVSFFRAQSNYLQVSPDFVLALD